MSKTHSRERSTTKPTATMMASTIRRQSSLDQVTKIEDPLISVYIEPDINGETSQLFRNALRDVVVSHRPAVRDLASYALRPGYHPLVYPKDSVLLVANIQKCSESAVTELAGSLALVVHPEGSQHRAGLPEDIEVGEVKKMIVLSAFRSMGVGRVLIEAAERIAKEKLGLNLLVLETWTELEGARKFYESCGWRVREHYGEYAEEGEVFYEKWIT